MNADCTSIFAEFETYLIASGWDVGTCEGYVLLGTVVNGSFRSKVRLINDVPVDSVEDICPFKIYQVIADDGMNVRESCPPDFEHGYNKKSYSKIPIKFHLPKGAVFVNLSNPGQLSGTDYWGVIGNEEHPLFSFYGDYWAVYAFLNSLSAPDV